MTHFFHGVPIDDGTNHVEIPTPEGWKCDRPNCPTEFFHKHSTYGMLLNTEKDESGDFKYIKRYEA